MIELLVIAFGLFFIIYAIVVYFQYESFSVPFSLFVTGLIITIGGFIYMQFG